jgi:diguanylate cyclase (GGDEF)-like protein/PAS domain S-box-containing protein
MSLQEPPPTGLDWSLQDQYRSIFENAIEGIYQTTIDGRYLRVNPALARIYGYDTPAELIRDLTDIAGQLYVDPTRREDFKHAMSAVGMVRNFEAQVYRRDGAVIWIAENARCVRDADGATLYYEGMVEDITARKSHEEQIRLLATVFESVADGILIVDRDLTVREVNPAFVAMTGHPVSALIGRPFDILEPGFHDKHFLPSIWTATRSAGNWSGEATCRRHNGPPFVAALSIAAVRDPKGQLSHAVITCSNISQRKEQEQRLWRHANFDLLTQLPNRWLLTERLEQAVLRAGRTQAKLAVLFLDLNGFKQINDGLGHQAGDALLRQVAQRLRGCTRLSDIVGRLGGDEFLVVAPEIAGSEDGAQFVNKILYSFREPFRIGTEEVFCLPSVGVAFFPEDGDSAEALIRHADLAMYEAKRNKLQRFVAYEPHMQARSDRRLALENDLRQSIEQQRFDLHFQPKVDSTTRAICGAEALIRWHHPRHGLVLPGEFIPLAEESGLIQQLGQWAFWQGCRVFQDWRQRALGLPTLSVNLSPRQFRGPDFIERLRRTLDETGIPPACIELELTESGVLADVEAMIGMLSALKALGVRLAIDDFGTGYSSLAYLKRLPIDVVKIDKSFVHEVAANPVDRKIVAAVIELAEALGFRVVAEGVETEAQATVLQEIGCHELQGYLISPPLPSDGFAALLRAGQTCSPVA